MNKKPIPYKPNSREWPEIYGMLCDHCEQQLSCDVIEGMIEMKGGGRWPPGGWVHDAGSGVSCLSYIPVKQKPLTYEQLKEAILCAVLMCSGCAVRKQSMASMCLHTLRDFKAAVDNETVFFCHHPDDDLEAKDRRPCGGWANAVSDKIKKRTSEG